LPRSLASRLCAHAGLLAVYTALTLVMSYPLILHLNQRVVGGGEDGWIFWWNNWWVRRALTTGESVYFTEHLFYPNGVDLTYHSFGWLSSGLALLLEPLTGPVAAYNLAALVIFPLAGWAMYLLVRELTGSRSGAFLAGLVYAFVPYRQGHIDHGTLLGTHWLPLFTLYLLRAFRDPSRRNILLASLFLVLTALVGWSLFIPAVIWAVFAAGYALLTRRGTLRRLLFVLACVFLISGLALMPLLVPLLTGRFGEQDALGDVQQDWTQTDPLGYLLPGAFHPVWGQAVDPLYAQIGWPRRVVSVGYVVMALLAYGLVRRGVRQRTGLWWWGALMWWLMALGPFLKFRGHVYRNIPLPYYPLSRLYVFQLLKLPERYNLFLILPVAVLVGFAAADLLPRLKRRWRAGLFAACCALVLLEYARMPWAMQQMRIPAFYRQLAEEEGDFGIVELPIDFHRLSKWYMRYQTIHGHPIAEGCVSRRPAEATAFLDAHPLLRSLYQNQEIDPALTDVSRQLRLLDDAGFRYVIIHPQFTEPDRVQRWQDWIATRPVFEDEDTIVYRTHPLSAADFRLSGKLADGIGIIDASLSQTTLPQDGTVEAHLTWGTDAPPAHDWLARLALRSPSGVVVAHTDFAPTQGWPTSDWGADAIARGSATVRMDPFAPGGPHTVTLQLVDPVDKRPAGPTLTLGRVDVHAFERVFELPEPQVPLSAAFGQDLRLLGYDLQQAPAELRLTLHWQAQHRMDTFYKFFVHLFDNTTGELVSQADVVPRDWSYPTLWWERGEVVSDEIILPTAGLAPGAYRLTVGVYDAETGARLPLRPPAPEGDALVLVKRLVLP
jgi:hypothetical protein